MAFPVGWTLLQVYVVAGSKVPNTNQTDFPVLMTGANFFPNTFDNCDNGGGDLRFSSDFAGATQLPCEVKVFNTATDVAEVYIKRTLTTGVGTPIYIWGKKTGETQPAATDTYGSQAVWNSGFVMVLHFQNAGTDSTSNANNINTNSGVTYAATGGPYGGLAAFDEGDYLYVLDAASVGLTTGVTMEGLVYPDTVATHHRMIFAKDDQFLNSGRNTYGLTLLNTSGNLYGGVTDASSSNADVNGNPVTVGAWNYIGFGWDTTDRYSQTNATQTSASTDALTSIRTNTDNLYIGKNNDATDPYGYDGSMAELRLSNVKRSLDWMMTTYNNLLSPSTFGSSYIPSKFLSVLGVG